MPKSWRRMKGESVMPWFQYLKSSVVVDIIAKDTRETLECLFRNLEIETDREDNLVFIAPNCNCDEKRLICRALRDALEAFDWDNW